MTPSQREHLNRFLAEGVLRWREGDHPEKHGTGQWMSEYDFPVWFTGNGDEFIISDAFNPLENWADCEPLLDKIERDGWEWSARKLKRIDSGAYYEFALTKTIDAHLIVARSVSRTEAICLAIALAYGWKEEG